MWRNYSVLLVVLLFTVSPALADLVDVTVSGDAGANGVVGARCEPPGPPACPNPGQEFDSEPLTFFGTNNNQDNFTISGSVTAASRATLSASAQQITDVSPNNISVDLQEVATTDVLGAEWGAGAEDNAPLMLSSYFLDFTLTTESSIQVTKTGCSSGVYTLCVLDNSDGSINIPLTNGGLFTLEPGAYVLTLHNELNATFGPPEEHETANSGLLVTADFTPVVPEPRLSIFVPVAMLGAMSARGWIRFRRRA